MDSLVSIGPSWSEYSSGWLLRNVPLPHTSAAPDAGGGADGITCMNKRFVAIPSRDRHLQQGGSVIEFVPFVAFLPRSLLHVMGAHPCRVYIKFSGGVNQWIVGGFYLLWQKFDFEPCIHRGEA